jgi:hypothetical protein
LLPPTCPIEAGPLLYPTVFEGIILLLPTEKGFGLVGIDCEKGLPPEEGAPKGALIPTLGLD